MREYVIDLQWDDEANIWIASNDEIPIALGNGSLDALIVLVRYAVPDMLEASNNFPNPAEVSLCFRMERAERLDCNCCLLPGKQECEKDETPMMSDYQFRYIMDLKDEIAALKSENATLKSKLEKFVMMQGRRRFPPLDAAVEINGDTVSVTAGEGEVIQVGKDEWEALSKALHFDDAVDCVSGETPMTLCQFRAFVELFRKNNKLKAEIESLRVSGK